MASDKGKRISGIPCPSCGKSGSEVQPDSSHRCRFCGHRWNPAERR